MEKTNDKGNLTNREKWILRIAIFFSIVGVVVLILSFFLFGNAESLYEWNSKIKAVKFGLFGDFIGGFIGSIWTLTGVILFYLALQLQRRDLKLAREQITDQKIAIEEQNRTFKTQQFDSRFFSMLENLQSIVSYLKHNDKTGKEFFVVAWEELQSYHSRVFRNKKVTHALLYSQYVTENDKNSKDQLKIEVINGRKIIIDKVYDRFFNQFRYGLGHYFRYIYHMIKAIVANENLAYDDKKYYIDQIQAQMSIDELGLMFYNALSKYGKSFTGEDKLRNWIDCYGFLENLDSTRMLYLSDELFYPNTKFKYFNND